MISQMEIFFKASGLVYTEDNDEMLKQQRNTMATSTDDLSDWVYKTTQAYNYKKREKTYVPCTTEAEARENAFQLTECEEMAKLKAERKEAKKKRRKERKKAEKIHNNGNMEKKSLTNSATSLEGNIINANRIETAEGSESDSLGHVDQEEQSDDEILDINAAFVKVSVKHTKNTVSHKIPVSKPEKPSLPDLMSMPMPRFVRPKIPNNNNHSDTSVSLGIQSCYLALNNSDFDRAIDCLSQAVFLDPDDVRHFLNRSYCYLRAGQYSLALRDAQNAKRNARSAEDLAKAAAREGQALCGLQQYHEAEKCFEEILKLGHGNKWILTELILARALQLTNMGFSKIDALKALQQCSAVVDAVTLLTSGNISSPEIGTNIDEPNIENCTGDEVYFSDNEASSTILLSQLVSTIADEACYMENIRSQSSPFKSQQCSNNFQRTSESDKDSMESLSQSNSIKSNDNIQWEVMNNHKSVASTSKVQNQKPLVSDSSSIWVGSIDKSIPDQKLRELFGGFGKINYIRRFPDERNYVFIDFNSKNAATKALNNANNLQINGIPLPVKPALGSCGKK